MRENNGDNLSVITENKFQRRFITDQVLERAQKNFEIDLKIIRDECIKNDESL